MLLYQNWFISILILYYYFDWFVFILGNICQALNIIKNEIQYWNKILYYLNKNYNYRPYYVDWKEFSSFGCKLNVFYFSKSNEETKYYVLLRFHVYN